MRLKTQIQRWCAVWMIATGIVWLPGLTAEDQTSATLSEIRKSFWESYYDPDERTEDALAIRKKAYDYLLERYEEIGLNLREIPDTSVAVQWALEGQSAEDVIPIAILEANHLHPDAYQFLFSIHVGTNPWFRPGMQSIGEFFRNCATEGKVSAEINDILTQTLQSKNPETIVTGILRTPAYPDSIMAPLLRATGSYRLSTIDPESHGIWEQWKRENLGYNDTPGFLALCALVFMDQHQWDYAADLLNQAGDELPSPTPLLLAQANFNLNSPGAKVDETAAERSLSDCTIILMEDATEYTRLAARIIATHGLYHDLPPATDTLLKEYLASSPDGQLPPLRYFRMALYPSEN